MQELMTLSSYLDNVVSKAFGVDKLDELFSTKLSKVQKGIYIDDYGNEAAKITRDFENGSKKVSYFINNKPVENLNPDIIDAMKINMVPDSGGILTDLPEPLVKGDDYPKLNIGFSPTHFVITANVAGVKAENIQITYQGGYVGIAILSTADFEKGDIKYLVKGFEETVNTKKQIYVDDSKFSIKDLCYEVKDGILRISIPRSESAETMVVFSPKKPFNPSSSTVKQKKQRLQEKKPVIESTKQIEGISEDNLTS